MGELYTMPLMNRRRKLFVYCPVCGQLLFQSATNDTIVRCPECRTELLVELRGAKMKIEMKGDIFISSEYDGTPEKDRRLRPCG